MNILFLGGAASGKSAAAEKKATELAKMHGVPLVYLATLNPESGGDTAERIQKHRRLRKGKGFATVEWSDCDAPPDVNAGARDDAADSAAVAGGNCPVVLLEDVGNLVANYLYPAGKVARTEAVDVAVSALTEMVRTISARCTDFVCVSNEIMLGGPLPEDMRFYGEVLAGLNVRWAAECDEVYMVTAGISCRICPSA